METLLSQKELIFEIKKQVENKDLSLYSHECIYSGEYEMDDQTISIVMSSSNRSKQTLFTLDKINNSNYKNIQVILVDDSTHDPITEDILRSQQLSINIDLINIKRENKKWHNPLVNYNIGFNYVKGGILVIQNAEVVHIGDVLQFIHNTVKDDNNYYVFDAKASLNYDTNELIYKSNTNTIEIYNENWFDKWYNSRHNNTNFHFLTAMHRNIFNKIKCFGYDCTMGTCWDDNELILKIVSNGIKIVNIWHEDYLVGGIHLFHGYSYIVWDKDKENNERMFHAKEVIYNKISEYIDATDNYESFDMKYKILNIVNRII
jgi:hypothetical protein